MHETIKTEALNAEIWNVDLEQENTAPLKDKRFAAIMVFRYLHRPLIKDIKASVMPGGILCYETFTIDQPQFGRPTNPDFLLKPQELLDYFKEWEILTYNEGIFGKNTPSALAQIICRKPW